MNAKGKRGNLRDKELKKIFQRITDLVDKLQKSSVEDSYTSEITEYELSQNYPNPFNPTTTIKYSLPEMQNIDLAVYNIAGKKVTQLEMGMKKDGHHKIAFDGTNLSSGIYYYKLKAGNRVLTAKKMILLK